MGSLASLAQLGVFCGVPTPLLAITATAPAPSPALPVLTLHGIWPCRRDGRLLHCSASYAQWVFEAAALRRGGGGTSACIPEEKGVPALLHACNPVAGAAIWRARALQGGHAIPRIHTGPPRTHVLKGQGEEHREISQTRVCTKQVKAPATMCSEPWEVRRFGAAAIERHKISTDS